MFGPIIWVIKKIYEWGKDLFGPEPNNPEPNSIIEGKEHRGGVRFPPANNNRPPPPKGQQ